MFADIPQPIQYAPPAIRWLQPVEQLKIEHTTKPIVGMELIDSKLATLPPGCTWEGVKLTPAGKRLRVHIKTYFCYGAE